MTTPLDSPERIAEVLRIGFDIGVISPAGLERLALHNSWTPEYLAFVAQIAIDAGFFRAEDVLGAYDLTPPDTKEDA